MAILRHICCVCGRVIGKDAVIEGDRDQVSHGTCDPKTTGRDCIKAWGVTYEDGKMVVSSS